MHVWIGAMDEGAIMHLYGAHYQVPRHVRLTGSAPWLPRMQSPHRHAEVFVLNTGDNLEILD